MTDVHDFQDRGDTARRAAGIDGTAGDAQDIPHRYVRDEPTGACLLCGLAEAYRKHTSAVPSGDAADSQQADSLDAVLRAARDDLHAQTNTPYHQARKEAFLRKLANGELEGDGAADCEHDWRPDESTVLPVYGATNVRYCTRCDALDWDDHPSCICHIDMANCPIHGSPGKRINPFVLIAALAKVAESQKTVTRAFERLRFDLAGTPAFQRGMRIASGRDVPPLPATDLPTRVDDLTSDTYDALRARYAWLEQRYRDTVDSEQGAMVVRQAKEIGELRQRGAEVLADRQWQRQQRDQLIRGIRILLTECPADESAGAIREQLAGLLGQHRDRIHESSCPEHTGFKVCYCDCMACRPGGVCACEHCKERHPGHQPATEAT